MITAERRPSELTGRPRATTRFGRALHPADARVAPEASEVPLVLAELEETGDGTGFLLAFVVTTMLMVLGVTALAVLQSWWLLVAVVLLHWTATYVILARIDGLLGQ